MKKILARPVLLIAAVVVALIMIRLGIWQLHRAAEKQAIFDKQVELSQSEAVILTAKTQLERFLPVVINGEFDYQKTVFLDNQVVDSKVGYRVFTPLRIGETDQWVLVDRGWVQKDSGALEGPAIGFEPISQSLVGRLNSPAAAPPLWKDEYAINSGAVWQYLPIDKLSTYMSLDLLPLVVELAPAADVDSKLVRRWRDIDHKSVGKHKAYALQWFAMAGVFLIACLILLKRTSVRRLKVSE